MGLLKGLAPVAVLVWLKGLMARRLQKQLLLDGSAACFYCHLFPLKEHLHQCSAQRTLQIREYGVHRILSKYGKSCLNNAGGWTCARNDGNRHMALIKVDLAWRG